MDMDTVHDSNVSVADGDSGHDIEAMSNDNGTMEGISLLGCDSKNLTVKVDIDTVYDSNVSVADGDSGPDIEAISNDKGTVEGISFGKEVMREVGSALIRLELDLARTSEKLVNMNLFMMQVAERESDFEAFTSENEDMLVDSTAKALEFEILSGIFDSEVRAIDKFISLLQSQIDYASEIISSHKHLGDALSEVEGKLLDAEESIKQSREQVSELMMQSVKFQRILPCSDKNNTYAGKDIVILEDGDFFNTSAKLKMQTSAQQQNILRMLEKSLARELDLDKKLTECTQALDEMKFRLCSSEQEILSLEEETASVYARCLEAENASVILMGISKELIGQLQSCQLNISSAVQRESELNSRLQNCIQAVRRIEKEEVVVQELVEKNNLEALALNEKVNALEEQLKTSEAMLLENTSNIEQIKELQEKIAIAESRVEKAEAECKLLAETNKGLDKEMDLLRGNGITSEKVDSLEKQLVETDIQLQQAMATVEASQEKQNMLYTTINDMDTLIQKLKSRVSEANARADDAEDKCIILSETNAALSEELTFLRGKLECLEASLQHAEEMKLATAKDIDVRTKMITELVMQLAIEREHLHKQIYMLMNENRALANKLDLANNTASKSMNCKDGENEKGGLFSERPAGAVDGGQGNQREDADTTEVKSEEDASCEPDSQNSKSKLETVRVIDPSWLSIKYLLSAILVAVIAVLAVCLVQQESCPF